MGIQILDQNTINQIAAGEVVERPASVVKELMENAIDAGATAITVEIRGGGIDFIRITDNGCGISKEELPLAFLRHSTSKIRTAEDLLTVSSLGFRGEALSSIAAVSQVELITKTADSLSGFRYQIEGGTEKGLEEVGAPEGTTFISRNLFFNTPARRKFLKTAATEGAHVADLVEKIALSHPEISIRLIINNQSRLHTSGNHSLKDIIYTVYGRDIASNLIPVRAENEMARITGFIGKPVIARNNRNFENYFINGRYIRSGLLARAIEEGYKSYMMQHKYPFTLLHVAVEPEYIDVNVHPSKMELRFKDGEGMFRLVSRMVAEALGEHELIPEVELTGKGEAGSASGKPEPGQADSGGGTPPGSVIIPAGSGANPGSGAVPAGSRMDPGSKVASDGSDETPAVAKPSAGKTHRPPEPFEVKRMEAMRLREPAAAYGTAAKEPEPAAGDEGNTGAGRTADAAPRQMDMFDDRLLSAGARYRHRLIGQVFDTYWLVEYGDSLYIIDQHAAHEKVLFEKNFASLQTREYTSQMISPPIILTLSMQEAELLKQHRDIFTEIGFEIEHFGGNEYAVRAVPDNLLSLAKKELLLELIDGLTEEGGRSGPESVYNRIAVMSCKAAVKGNNRLSEREANELIDQLLKLENPYTCPHGRPTIVSLSKYEMEKRFKRIVT